MMLNKLLELLNHCPTCTKILIVEPGTTIYRCPDIYHGRFVVEQTTQGGFFITFQPSRRSVA